LGLDLYRIDLARVVSKYIGETEKNLDRVFDAAERANAILFFDEADALFGKRSEVKEAHDRYANIEVSYLLQKMEDYEGFAILASNLPASLDAAFTRRLAYCIHFPLPDEAARLEIWRRAWPGAVPIADDIDCRALARELKIAGGGIRNIALGAAFSAAANGGVVNRAHVAHAVVREYEKSGRASALPAHFAASVPPFEAVG
jgi:SpoVK/Ycf46/Vps4 family AAA+-type ATPase